MDVYYNLGPSEPPKKYSQYPWLNTTDGKWYLFDGTKWVKR